MQFESKFVSRWCLREYRRRIFVPVPKWLVAYKCIVSNIYLLITIINMYFRNITMLLHTGLSLDSSGTVCTDDRVGSCYLDHRQGVCSKDVSIYICMHIIIINNWLVQWYQILSFNFLDWRTLQKRPLLLHYWGRLGPVLWKVSKNWNTGIWWSMSPGICIK